MKAMAIIGSAFGDEGKGRMTHVFASQAKGPSVVVRYNGGPQAGHTVVREDGVGHVFHHFGSGTLDGSATYLSRFFICNPLLWIGENKDLGQYVEPKFYVDPASPITTPYDMLINREVERARGSQRHGSCGYGVNETVVRLCEGKFPLFAWNMECKDFAEKVRAIRDVYLPNRLASLGLVPSDNLRQACASSLLFDEFMDSAAAFHTAARPMLASELERWNTVIFEGSQGLCLDETFRFFPHVTRSRTGLPNIVTICESAGISELDVVYVTRAYTTRHGHGPLPTEDASLSYKDATNVENEWQGSLRFGCLDIDLIGEAVRGDRKKRGNLKVKFSLAITCMDQVGDNVAIHHKGVICRVSRDELARIAAKACGMKQVYLSWKA
ncbi:MAG: adenylosuccinate synthetase [Phycisphaerales bacterium]